MSKVSEYYIIEEKIHEYQAGEVDGHFAYIEKKAQKDNQDQVILKDGHQLDVVPTLENIDIPIEQVVREKVKKQDTGNGCYISFGESKVADLDSAGKYAEKKGQNDTKAFQAKDGIIFNQSLFLANI